MPPPRSLKPRLATALALREIGIHTRPHGSEQCQIVVRLHGSDAALYVADNVLVPIAVTDELCVAAVLHLRVVIVHVVRLHQFRRQLLARVGAVILQRIDQSADGLQQPVLVGAVENAAADQNLANANGLRVAGVKEVMRHEKRVSLIGGFDLVGIGCNQHEQDDPVEPDGAGRDQHQRAGQPEPSASQQRQRRNRQQRINVAGREDLHAEEVERHR